MSLPVRINAGERWEFRSETLIFQRELGDDFIHFMRERNGGPFQLEDISGVTKWPNTAWFIEQFASGCLRRLPNPHDAPRRRKAVGLDEDLDALDKLDANARLRAFVLRGLDAIGDIPRSDRAISLALTRLWAEQPEKACQFAGKPCERSVRRWLKERGTFGERRLAELIARNGRVERARRLPSTILELMRRSATWYWTRLGWTIDDAYARFVRIIERINRWRVERGTLPRLQPPSTETFRKEVRDLESFETYQLKHGTKKARARFKACGVGLSASRFLRLGCMDHTVLDGIAVIDSDWMLPVGRPYLTVLIDVKTRCVVGFVLSYEPPSIYSVMECIKRANRPKLQKTALTGEYPVLANIFGRFDEIVVDNGKEFAGTSLEDAMAELGTTIRLAPVASPTHKAIVERFFRTLNQLLNTKVPGAVFKPELLREMGYDPSKDAVLTISQLEALIYEALAVYHVKYHKGIGAVPARLWQQDVDDYRVDFIDDDSRLEKMLGKVEPSRTVTRSGISLFGLQYHDEGKVTGLLEDLIAFEPVLGQRKGSATVKVKVKYNPANLAEVHVWNRRRKRYVTLPCLDERYTAGISLWHHRKLQEWARNKDLEFNTETQRLQARASLIEQIEDSAPHLKGAALRAARRLLNAPQIERSSEGGVTSAYAPARHDGLAPTINYNLLADTRTDQGQSPKRPPRPQKPKVERPKCPRKGAKRSAGSKMQQPADFLVDLSQWREIDL